RSPGRRRHRRRAWWLRGGRLRCWRRDERSRGLTSTSQGETQPAPGGKLDGESRGEREERAYAEQCAFDVAGPEVLCDFLRYRGELFDRVRAPGLDPP